MGAAIHLPEVHGFDAFLGSFYHLNAEQATWPVVIKPGGGMRTTKRLLWGLGL
jgi:hypothetical protein